MQYKSLGAKILFFLFACFLAIKVDAQEVDIDAGKALFKVNCASCHNKNMKDDLTGPALGGVQDRWADYSQEELYAWIRNSQAVIASGNPRAIEVFQKWNKTEMTAFPNLKDEEIANILAFVDFQFNKVDEVKVDGPGVAAQDDNTFIYVSLLFVLALLAMVLARVVTNLNHITEAQEGHTVERKTLADILTSKGVIGFVVFALVVVGAYTTVSNAVDLGRQQGYEPEQPIKFSHATHAGVHKIDCQYCHDGARRSKHSIIPAANTCMNCHKAIEKGSKHGTAEITKIYASIGYDPSEKKYLEDYEEYTEEQVEAIYKKWIGDQYVKDNGGKLDKKGENLIEDQWTGIKSSLTNENKTKIQGPIEWIRVHNLPDHVYFNHAQHVSVGKVECQQCHGKVEDMDLLRQYAPLSMGWCVNCHRETEVKFVDNEYYKIYEQYHKEMQEGKRDKVTVEEIGGIECQKCHY